MILNIQFSYSQKAPFNDEECRLCLYETLHELCLSSNTKHAPPLSVSVKIFESAKTDCSPKVFKKLKFKLIKLKYILNIKT